MRSWPVSPLNFYETRSCYKLVISTGKREKFDFFYSTDVYATLEIELAADNYFSKAVNQLVGFRQASPRADV